MAKLMKRNKPACVAPPADAPPKEEPIPVPVQEEEQEEHRPRRSNPLPSHKNATRCSKCSGEMAIYSKDPDPFSQDKLRTLFHERGHSLELCGFCQRAADRAAGKYKPFVEPPDRVNREPAKQEEEIAA